MLKRRFFSYLKSQVQCRQYSPKNNVARKIKTLLHDLTLFFFFLGQKSHVIRFLVNNLTLFFFFFGQYLTLFCIQQFGASRFIQTTLTGPERKQEYGIRGNGSTNALTNNKTLEMKILNFLFPFYLSLLFYCHPNHILNLMSRGDYIQL